ncbi:MAG: hypothetical protein ACRBFS_01250 [Aureispira sp.]
MILKKNALGSVILWILLSFGMMACTTNKTASVSKKEKNSEIKGILLFGDQIREENTYESINGNIPRLKFMLAGQFIQYVRDSLGNYGPWLVNEGKDSVLIYQIPVGNPNKDGHWVYNYQYLTSLPNDPVISSFSKMTALNRDSIVLVDYDAPDNFEASIEDILVAPEKVFKEFDFKKLKPSIPLYRVDYVRQTPLHYIGICENKLAPNGQPVKEGKISYSYHAITPALYSYGMAEPEGDSWKQLEQVPFFKKAMVKLP